MQIRILYFAGCPNKDSTVDLVRRIAREHGLEQAVETAEVRSPQEATDLRFLGSPTVRIDGVDIDPTARDRTEYGMVCRHYGASGVPPIAMIAAAIREASA